MSRREDRPFQQRRPSWRERRDSERRARSRAAALAEALPPPDAALRVDPDRPAQPHAPAAAQSQPGPSAPTGAPAAPGAARLPRRSLSDVAHAATPPPASSVPAAFTPPSVPGYTAPSVPGVPTWGTPESDAAADTDPAPAPWRRPWSGRAAALGLSLALATVVLAVVVGLGWGAPVLGHPQRWELLAGSGVALLLSAWALTRSWGQVPQRGRRAGAGVALVLCAAFGIGVATNPVVVDGRVFLSTSVEAKQFRLMQQVHEDLLRMRQLDVYLTYSAADAGAHYNEYGPAMEELGELSNRYARMSTQDLPDPRFADTVDATKSAAYWAQQAMEAKVSLLTQDDARTAANVTSFRADFAEQFVAAGRALSFLSADLNIPLETREHE